MENKNQVIDQMSDKVSSVTTRTVGVKFGWISALVGIALFLVPLILRQNSFKGVWKWVGAGVSKRCGLPWGVQKKLFRIIGTCAAFFGGMLFTLILTIFTQKKAPEQAF